MKILFTAVFFLCNISCFAQFGNAAWRGKKAAVVLTYDDAIDQHLDNALPVLDSLNIKATFYITAFSPSMQARLNDWKKLSSGGHELGNHTLYHPCVGGTGREWVSKQNDLRYYSVKRIENEIRMTNLFLQSLDGKTKRTFAFTCGDMKVDDSLFMNGMKTDFVAARGVRNEMHKINEVDLYNTDCYVVNNHSFEQMKEWVDKAIQANSLLIILFHGVGGGNSLNVSIDDHRKILSYIKQQEKDLMIAPMLEVAEHIKTWQANDKAAKAQQEATQADYENMLTQLNIPPASKRPGPSGNPSAPNAANSDESKATQYTSLPDPLVLNNGKKVAGAKTWWNKRRPEIAEAFEKEIYGRVPRQTPKVIWEVVSTGDTVFGNQKAIAKNLLGHVDNSAYPQIKVDMQLSLITPKNINRPVPVIMEFGFILPAGFRPPNNTAAQKSWQEQLLENEYGFAIIVPTSYQADNGAGLTQGIIGLCNKGQNRKPGDWGALRAWAWGASRAIDYFETDKNVDAKKIGIEGLSRYGKAAIVTMAFEPRIAIGFIGSSGAGGTKILRRIYGEQVENLASSGEYHWFAGNFIKYACGALTQNNLPVDAHELVALCAPRPVFISSGSPNVEGKWVDAKGMFLGGAYAAPVYELLGKKGYGTMEYPQERTALVSGDIAFRQHEGGHTTGPNWPTFIEWAKKYFK
ncbi:MAG: polysaccharide deacetylase family protein [Ferruginibacter sp.]